MSNIPYSNPSAVKIIHLPTNTTVVCSSDRAMHRNKAKALKCLQSKLVAIFGRIPVESDFEYEYGGEDGCESDEADG